MLVTFADSEAGWSTRCHLGSSRKIHPGQKIHSSLFLADTHEEYTPKARPLPDDKDSFWDDLRHKKENQREWLERDLYEYTGYVMKKFSGDLQTLQQIGTSSKRAPFFRFCQSFKRGGQVMGGKQYTRKWLKSCRRAPVIRRISRISRIFCVFVWISSPKKVPSSN